MIQTEIVKNVRIAQGTSPHELEAEHIILEMVSDVTGPRFFSIPEGVTGVLRHKVNRANPNARVAHKDIEIIGDNDVDFASYEQREYNPLSKTVTLVVD